ncbi:MAG: flagellar export protein FliJ [Oscillospiraceae bacterium]
MKKFEFSLNRIRQYKNVVLDREKNVLSGLLMEQRNINDRMEELEKQLEDINKEMHCKMQEGLEISQIRLYEFRKDGVREEERKLSERLDFLQVSIDRQLKRVSSLKREVTGYDKLEEKQREEYDKEAAKEQELVISEFISQKLIRESNG